MSGGFFVFQGSVLLAPQRIKSPIVTVIREITVRTSLHLQNYTLNSLFHQNC
jgi:hypothetical protein